jgi:hypothetical protein
MASLMVRPHVIAPHAGGTEFFGHTVMLTRISKRKEKQKLMSGARHLSFTSVQTVAAWHFGVGFKRTNQAKLELL